MTNNSTDLAVFQVNRLKARCLDVVDFLIDRPYGTDDYLLLNFLSPVLVKYFPEGDAAGILQEVKAGACLIYPPACPQWYYSPGQPMLTNWLHFSGPGVDRLLDQLQLPLGRIFYPQSDQLIAGAINQIQLEHLSGDDPDWSGKLISLMGNQFLIQLARSLHRSSQDAAGLAVNQHRPAFNQLRRQLSDLPAENWSLDRMARQVNLSVSRMLSLYRRFFRTSPQQDLLKFRIQQACYELSTSDLPISQIIKLCGYASPTHFFRQFRQHTGLTPSHYRQNRQPGWPD